jgi:hypothetical protein
LGNGLCLDTMRIRADRWSLLLEIGQNLDK